MRQSDPTKESGNLFGSAVCSDLQHYWTQQKPGKWPYVGQTCVCGKRTWSRPE